MQRPDWAGESTDMERPSVARMYDDVLGGSRTFAVDREAAERTRLFAVCGVGRVGG
jgi:S-adenosyl methyltransferase